MDLWEVTEGACFLSTGGANGAAGLPRAGAVHAEISDSAVRFWPAGSTAIAETAAMLRASETSTTTRCCGSCFGNRRRSRGGSGSEPVTLCYADLLGAVVDRKSGSVRLVHCPPRQGNSQSGRLRQDLVLQIVAPGASGQQSPEAQLASSDANPELWKCVEGWAAKVNERCLVSVGQRRLLVFINPTSGNRKAQQIWGDVRRLWESLPWIAFEEVVTSYAGEASERCKDSSVLSYNGLVIVSGDGLVHEVLNGLASRPDAAQALRVPVAHIPAGSGNGLAKSVLASSNEGYGTMEAAFAIAKGYKSPLHLMQIQQQGEPVRTSFLSLSGAIVSDIDIESEKLRCIGPARFTVWALYRAMRPRPLHAELIYWPANAASSPPVAAPDISTPLAQEPWVRDEDNFLFFWGMNVPWAAYDACPAPGVGMHESIWHLVVVRCSAPRSALVKCLLSLETGAQVDQEHVEVIPCRAFRLVPRESPRGGILSLDGERIPFGPVQVWPSAQSTEVLGCQLENGV